MQSVAPSFTTEPSAALLEAQARLLQLRAQQGIEVTRPSAAAPRPMEPPAPQPQPVSWLLANAEKELAQRREQAGIQVAAPSAAPSPLAALIATAQARLADRHPPVPDPHLPAPTSQTIVVHPTLVLALLKEQLEAPARVYFLLRYIDRQGRGWLDVEDVRRELTHKESPLKICGWRRLRQLLHEGEGIFWKRDADNRLWLKGLHRIAYRLDLGRLQGFPIELPIEALLGGIQAVRAAFYACFHGGRDVRPISRETLRQLSGIAERTQRDYDSLVQVKRRRNIAIGEAHSQENIQERAWRQGRGVFHFVDVKGRQGRKNRAYIAWQLPNSYEAPYQRRSRGSRKRLNRKLKDLLTKGITGNVETAVERIFYATGALAAKAYNRDPEHDAYWEGKNPTRDRSRLWHVITGIHR
jgi:hypothetical protein